MSDGNPNGSFAEELSNAFATVLLWLFKAVKFAFLLFAWIIIIGCAITKNR